MNKIDIKRNLLIAGILTLFLASFVKSSLNLALPALALDLNLSKVLTTWIPTLYLMVNAILFVPLGRISDIYGRKRIFQYGLIIFTISSFLCAFSTSIEMLLIVRVFQAIGNAMMFASLYALVSSPYTLGKTGEIFGIMTTGIFIGLILGPILGGLITQMLGWRYLFHLDAFIGICIILIVFRFKEDWQEVEGERFDILGSAVLGLSILLMVYGFSDLSGSYNLLILTLGLILFLVFYLVEKGSTYPLIKLELFKSKNFTFGSITSIINYSSFIAVNYLLCLYLNDIKGFEPIKSGLILSISAILMLVISPVAGKISDKVNPVLISTIGIILITIGIAITSLINESINLGLLILGLIIFGLGNGLFLPSNTKAVITSADKKDYGVSGATLNDTRVVGQIFGMAIIIFVFSTFLGNTNAANFNHLELLISIKISLIILLLISAAGIVISLLSFEFDFSLKFLKNQMFCYTLLLSNKFLNGLKRQKENILSYFK